MESTTSSAPLDAPLIAAEDIGKTVTAPGGSLTILHPLSLAVSRGESVAIVGPSGSGKTTLLGLLAALDLPSSGRLVFDGHVVTELDEDQRAALRSGRVGFVFQSFHLLKSLTALENVMLPLELSSSGEAPRARATAILERVGLGERLDHYPRQLSGGEQQRVAIARAFVTQPIILFADEPTGNLDAATGQQAADLLFELNADHGATLVLVTHDLRLAERCSRIIRIEAGRIIEAAA